MVSRPARHKNGGQALHSATKTADKNNGGQARHSATKTADKNNGGQVRLRRVNPPEAGKPSIY